MGICAIICELNPLHLGHLYLIEEAKKNGDKVVLIMSGNFTQRAGCAVCHKHIRAKSAIQCGADLVLELPFPYSSSGAEFFAHAGVEIAEKSGATRLVFGSESGDMTYLSEIAKISSSAEYSEKFALLSKEHPSEGAAQIRTRVFCEMLPDYPKERVSSPNDVLATQYIRFAKIKCEAVKRIDTMSASKIREIGREEAKAFIPDETYEMLGKAPISDNSLMYNYLWQYLRMNEIKEKTAETVGGLGNRLKSTARNSTSAKEFFENCRTKKYTDSRILRASLFSAMGISEEDIRTLPKFTNVLSANEKGCEILANLRHIKDFAVITKPSSYKSYLGKDKILDRQMELSIKSDELFTLFHKTPFPSDYFMIQTPYIKNDVKIRNNGEVNE